ncbi:MAG: HAMP domain-containing sensor histidine kinase [Bacteroidota bacterium]
MNLRRIWTRLHRALLPRRASTQTWMMLTFAFFVGASAVGIGLYVLLVLRVQVRDAARETVRLQAERIAVQIEAAPAERRADLARRIAVQDDLDVALATRDAVLANANDAGPVDDPSFFGRPEVRDALDGDGTESRVGFDERRTEGGEVADQTLYVALWRPESGLLIRLGEARSPLFEVVRRMQATLVIGMALALMLALIAAWIAAQKIVGPLGHISRIAQRIDAGETDRQIRVLTRAAEIQDLARSLNSMAQRFRGEVGELQRMQQIQNEFIGNVSHEVKNPIFAVSGYLEALGSSDLPPDLRQRYARKGLMNLERLNNLFSDLIEIAKLEYREDLIHPERFDLQELVADVSETVVPKAQGKGLDLTFDNPAAEVWADRARIRQVLTNLIENAVNYSEAGSVRARLRQRKEKVRVEVVDTGRGIPEESLDRIFERFYRIDTARSRKEGGTGLGLSIVKQILQAHGEQIHVESITGRGTRFYFELPLADYVDAAQQAEEDAEFA